MSSIRSGEYILDPHTSTKGTDPRLAVERTKNPVIILWTLLIILDTVSYLSSYSSSFISLYSSLESLLDRNGNLPGTSFARKCLPSSCILHFAISLVVGSVVRGVSAGQGRIAVYRSSAMIALSAHVHGFGPFCFTTFYFATF